MKIRDRLSVYFTLVCATVLLLMISGVYFSFRSFMRQHFFDRLRERATVAALLNLEADEVSRKALLDIREKYMEKIPGEVIRIYDSKNSAVFIPDDQQYWPARTIEEVRKSGSLSYFDKTRQVVGIFYKDNQGDFVILVSAEDRSANVRMNYLLQAMGFIFILVIILVFFFSQWLAKKALSPIDKIIGEMQGIRASNLYTRIPVADAKDEIGALALNFNSLMGRLEESFELQKVFIAAASHELRTPLTSITGEAEVALNKIRDPEEYSQILKSILADTERLNDTVSGLMELAQTEIELGQGSIYPVRIDDLLWEQHESWSAKLYPGALNIEMNNMPEDEELLQINANRALLTIVLNNILGNAFKFSHNKPVQCSLSCSKTTLKISIQDEGPGIAAEDLKKIFEPFYRSHTAASFPGSGIGLYITWKILRLFGGEISISPSPLHGTVAEITFVKNRATTTFILP